MSHNYYTPIGGLGIGHLGQAADSLTSNDQPQLRTASAPSPVYR